MFVHELVHLIQPCFLTLGTSLVRIKYMIFTLQPCELHLETLLPHDFYDFIGLLNPNIPINIAVNHKSGWQPAGRDLLLDPPLVVLGVILRVILDVEVQEVRKIGAIEHVVVHEPSVAAGFAVRHRHCVAVEEGLDRGVVDFLVWDDSATLLGGPWLGSREECAQGIGDGVDG